MAISKKNKRKVVFEGKEYLWWVFDEVDQTEFDGIQTKVVCSDQGHFFKYGLQQINADRKVVFALNNYSKLVHFTCPKFENEEGIITKSGICTLIQWCKSQGAQIMYAVDQKNNRLSNKEKETLLEELRKIIQ